MIKNITKTLYEQDFNLWIETTVQKMRSRDLDNLDWDNLIEEIESLGNNDKQALKSNLRILLMHLLKWQYQPEKRSHSWDYTIAEYRNRLEDGFENSPSLRNYYALVWAECYQKARKLAAKETGLPLITFRVECPFSLAEILNSDD